MEAETLEALLGSIEKWTQIVNGTTAEDRRINNCPLCTMFLHNNCLECPVSKATGVSDCKNSPYVPWKSHRYNCISRHHAPGCEECLRLAKDELAFLVGLLPNVAR